MKRDLDLIRYILLTMEEKDSKNLVVEDFVNAKYNPKQISQHIDLLLDVDYITAIRVTHMESPYEEFLINRITMPGYSYLDSVRDAGVWLVAKSKLGGFASSVTLEVVKSLAGKIALEMLGM